MVERSRKPSALSQTNASSPQLPINVSYSDSRVSAALPSGESIEILLFGATIISWKNKAGEELLWLSEAAKLDGTKAVRGGIPLVFPVFGTNPSHTSTSKLAQHGFARTSNWEFLGKSTSESGGGDSVKLDFGLSPANLSEEVKKNWPFAFGLIYSVTLAEEGLTTSLVVRNEGETAWDFQTLLHTYFRVKDISTVEISGLDASPYTDKLKEPVFTGTSGSGPLKITSEVDQVYTPANDPHTAIIIFEEAKKKFSISRDNLNEIVVWNPWKDAGAKMADFAPAQAYQKMICVEAGAVNGWIELGPGDTWEGGQTISAI
ncbi:hypothetical protein K3495_g3073 [Podosphaera aphanis]|nr:hypothetical protein K3495_g3073 [Podosphaera aphanis]